MFFFKEPIDKTDVYDLLGVISEPLLLRESECIENMFNVEFKFKGNQNSILEHVPTFTSKELGVETLLFAKHDPFLHVSSDSDEDMDVEMVGKSDDEYDDYDDEYDSEMELS
ncbi:hypothetical protein PCE1_000556 [Barthelona sp. PCE]